MSIDIRPVSLKRIMEARMRRDGFIEYRIPSSHHIAYHSWRKMDFSKDVTTDMVQKMNPQYEVVILPPEVRPTLEGLLPKLLESYYNRVSPEMKQIMEQANEEDLFVTWMEQRYGSHVGYHAPEILEALKAIQKATMR